MAAHLPYLPVLIFVFLAVHVPATHGDPLPATYNVSMCSESFWCGSVEISYPFYLANATEATGDYSGSYYSCGYTDLNISCKQVGQTWIPTIRLGRDNYTVTDITYDYNYGTISLADSDVLGGGDCPAVRHNVSFNEVWLYNTSTFENITFFFGCHGVLSEYPDNQIRCPGFRNPAASGGASFVFKAEELEKPVEQEFAAHCDEVFSVPVRSEALLGSTDLANFTRDGYGKVLKQGFELAWRRISWAWEQCHQCERRPESGGRCAYSQSREFLGCLCDGGKVGNPDCNHIVSPRKTSKSF